jgi:hypothetical protein
LKLDLSNTVPKRGVNAHQIMVTRLRN